MAMASIISVATISAISANNEHSSILFSSSNCGNRRMNTTSRSRNRIRVQKQKQTPAADADADTDEVTKKYGLEAGLWKIFSSKEDDNTTVTSKSKGDQAKELLTKYGGAYLATSITLSLISFSLCYGLITAGVDVPALLQKVGISANETGEKVGTFALAYAAHKAASPIRFPPTVALTPIVASWIGKKVDKDD